MATKKMPAPAKKTAPKPPPFKGAKMPKGA